MSDDDSSAASFPWFLVILAVVLAGTGAAYAVAHGVLRSLAAVAFVLVAVGAVLILAMFLITQIIVRVVATRARVPVDESPRTAYLTLLGAAAVGALIGFGAPVTGPSELASGVVILFLYYGVAYQRIQSWRVEPRWVPTVSVWILSIASVAVGGLLLFAT